MTDFKVTAPHQVERDGRFFSPNQIVPGFDPRTDEDSALRSLGLISEVRDVQSELEESEPEEVPAVEKPAASKRASGAKASSAKNKEQA